LYFFRRVITNFHLWEIDDNSITLAQYHEQTRQQFIDLHVASPIATYVFNKLFQRKNDWGQCFNPSVSLPLHVQILKSVPCQDRVVVLFVERAKNWGFAQPTLEKIVILNRSPFAVPVIKGGVSKTCHVNRGFARAPTLKEDFIRINRFGAIITMIFFNVGQPRFVCAVRFCVHVDGLQGEPVQKHGLGLPLTFCGSFIAAA